MRYANLNFKQLIDNEKSHCSAIIGILLSCSLAAPVYAQSGYIDEAVYRFYAPSSMQETVQIAAANCLLGGGDKSMTGYRTSSQDTNALSVSRYCTSVFAATEAHKKLVGMVEFHRDTELRSDTAFAFALGFVLGIAEPAKYAQYAKASDQMIDNISEGCMPLSGNQNRQDCMIAGALRAIRAEAELIRLAQRFPSH